MKTFEYEGKEYEVPGGDLDLSLFEAGAICSGVPESKCGGIKLCYDCVLSKQHQEVAQAWYNSQTNVMPELSPGMVVELQHDSGYRDAYLYISDEWLMNKNGCTYSCFSDINEVAAVYRALGVDGFKYQFDALEDRLIWQREKSEDEKSRAIRELREEQKRHNDEFNRKIAELEKM